METKAVTVPDAIVLLMAAWHENQLVLETSCEDYDVFKSLPAVVTFKGVQCGKTGWSSDTHRACYKSGAMIAHVTRE